MIDIIRQYNIGKTDILKNFPIFGNVEEISLFLKRYTLFKETIERPGDILIVGYNCMDAVLTFANFMEALTIGDRTRQIWAFDGFKPSSRYPLEDEYISRFKKAIEIFDKDRYVPWKKRIQMQYGNDPLNDLDSFLQSNKGLRTYLVYAKHIQDKAALKTIVEPVIIKNGAIEYDE